MPRMERLPIAPEPEHCRARLARRSTGQWRGFSMGHGPQRLAGKTPANRAWQCSGLGCTRESWGLPGKPHPGGRFSRGWRDYRLRQSPSTAVPGLPDTALDLQFLNILLRPVCQSGVTMVLQQPRHLIHFSKMTKHQDRYTGSVHPSQKSHQQGKPC